MLQARRERGWVELTERYGKNFRYQGALATCDPAVIETLLMHREHTQERSITYKFAAKVVSGAPGLLFMDGADWLQQLHAAMPPLTRASVQAYAQTVHATTDATLNQWHDGTQIPDLYRTMTELGLQVVLRVGYGLDPHDPLAAAFGATLMRYKLSTMSTPARIYEFGFSLGQLRHTTRFVSDYFFLRRSMCDLRQQLQAILDAGAAKYQPNWISLFSKLDVPLEVMADGLNHLYGAFNAIDYSLTCALYELSRHPEWAERLRTELDAVLGTRTYPSPHDFAALPQMMAFMKEIFRHYPVTGAVVRRSGTPLMVEGEEFPARQEVLILVNALHHHPDFWADPFTFNPTRWLDTPEPAVLYSYIPFLVGPRQCIGRHLAELHFVVTLNALLRRFRVQALDHSAQILPFLIPRFEHPLPAIIHSVRET
ncbi:MAG: cytochrome P450 [Chloroflexota bacterium]